MAVNNVRQQIGYGLTNALQDVPYGAIVSKRAPANTDKAPIGQIWIDIPNNDAYILTNIVANSASWINMAGGAGSFNSLNVTTTITAGTNITATAGNIAATAGTVTGGTGLIATTGGVTASAGNIVATLGNITASAGNIAATLGSISAGTSVTGGTGVIATTGDITATAGNVIATVGHITASAGAVTAGTTVTGGTGVIATTGDVTSTAGDLVASTAAKGVVLGGGAKVICGTGSPNTVVTAPKGSLYLNLTGSGVADRAFINTDGVTAWTAISTVA